MSKQKEEMYKNKVTNMPLQELEEEIYNRYVGYLRGKDSDTTKLMLCLKVRKNLINKNFKFTDIQIKRIEKLNQLLIDATADLLKKSDELIQYIKDVKTSCDAFWENYFIEAKLTLEFLDDKSLLVLEEDENNGQSDYQTMVGVLDESLTMPLNNFYYYKDMNNQPSKTKAYEEEKFHKNWNIEELSAAELQHIPYFCYASYILFCHTYHSYSDIIRIKSFRNEINVCWLKEIKV